MKLLPVIGNTQKLDGGAMFGHVPKELWSKWLIPDEKNRIQLACRGLLIQEENRRVLLETGVGLFFDPVLRERYGVEENEHVLLNSLKSHGLTDADIDIVVISHMHFDHAGGLLAAWEKDKEPELLFPNAKYVVGKLAWQRATHPHVRDRASFIPVLNNLLEASGRLVLIDGEHNDVLGEHYQFRYSHGHTPGLMHTIVNVPGEDPVIFASDLIPGTPWVHLPVTMGYDRSAELIIDEKHEMLDYALAHRARLFYTHDPETVMSHIMRDEKGRYKAVA